MSTPIAIEYSIVQGQLPSGLTLDPIRGTISGSPDYSNIGSGPTWNTSSGSLGIFNQNTTITPINLSVSSSATPIIFTIPGDSDRLPPGLTLRASGLLSGTTLPFSILLNSAPVTEDGPTWTTGRGLLSTFNTGNQASIQLVATPQNSRTISRFTITSGALPWGLVLSTSGLISGTVLPLLAPGSFVDIPAQPVPMFTQASGSLGTFSEFQSNVSIQITATPQSGKTIKNYFIKSGILPWGLVLNSSTGVISGNIAELKFPETQYSDGNNPIMSSSVVVNGTTISSSLLGTFSKGSTINMTFSATPYSGRTVRYVLTSGYLPWGLKLSEAGVVSGTVSSRTVSQTYSIGITAIDNTYDQVT